MYHPHGRTASRPPSLAAQRSRNRHHALAFAALAAASPAWAGVAYVVPDVTYVAPPADVRSSMYESDTEIRLFVEQRSVTLAAPLSVDLTVPGTYDATIPTTPGTIPAGTVVHSYFAHLDHAGSDGVVTLSGGLTVDEPILGIIVSDDLLSDSDPIVGNPGTTYPTGTTDPRGVELWDDDVVAWTGTTKIDLELENFYATDQLRVITYAGPAGMTFSIDRQGPTFDSPPAFGIGTGPTPGMIGEADILTVGAPGPGPGPYPAAAAPLPAPGIFLSSSGLAIGGLMLNFEELDALSYGRDQLNGRIYFSVDEFAKGRNGAAYAPLRTEATTSAVQPQQAAADVFRSTDPAPLVAPPVNGNQAWTDGDGMWSLALLGIGLVEPNLASAALPDIGDNLDALDMDTAPADASGFVYFSLDADFDDPAEGGMLFPNYASANAFELACFGVTTGVAGADIFVVPGGATTCASVSIYARWSDLGLNEGDDVDALALWDDGDGVYDPGVDRILYSLRRASSTIGTADCGGVNIIEAGDILEACGFGAPRIAFRADRLGLRTVRGGAAKADDLDALDFVRD